MNNEVFLQFAGFSLTSSYLYECGVIPESVIRELFVGELSMLMPAVNYL